MESICASAGPAGTNRAVNINYGDLVQFCHVRSQRWLCVHMKQHSSREKSSLRVSLAKASVCLRPLLPVLPKNSPRRVCFVEWLPLAAQELDEDTMFRFKVAPRYKVRSEGERRGVGWTSLGHRPTPTGWVTPSHFSSHHRAVIPRLVTVYVVLCCVADEGSVLGFARRLGWATPSACLQLFFN